MQDIFTHESFEDPETAAFINEHSVNIKIDRDERSDLGSMAAIHWLIPAFRLDLHLSINQGGRPGALAYHTIRNSIT